MNTYFTSDLHLHHHNIVRYCHRPYSNSAEMDDDLINNWNKTVSAQDTIYHLGDFCFTNNSDHYYLMANKLHGKIMFLKGNHDQALHHKVSCYNAEIDGLKMLLVHYPPSSHFYDIPSDTDIILCGHIHNRWKWSNYKGIPVVNVGVDVWNYKPVSLNEITLACINKQYRQELTVAS